MQDELGWYACLGLEIKAPPLRAFIVEKYGCRELIDGNWVPVCGESLDSLIQEKRGSPSFRELGERIAWRKSKPRVFGDEPGEAIWLKYAHLFPGEVFPSVDL